MTEAASNDWPVVKSGTVVFHGLSSPSSVTIEPGRVSCGLGLFAGSKVLVHHDPEIRVICARLLPWPLRTYVELRDERTGNYAYFAQFFHLRRTRQALAAAGFRLHDVSTWFFLGGFLTGPYRRRGDA